MDISSNKRPRHNLISDVDKIMEGMMEDSIAEAMRHPQMHISQARYEVLCRKWSTPLYTKPVPKRRVRRVDTVDFSQTTWGKWLVDPTLRVQKSYLWKQFRRNFRMPPDLFLDHFVVEVCYT
jgi:hypothetical protein